MGSGKSVCCSVGTSDRGNVMNTVQAKLDVDGFVFASFGLESPSEFDDVTQEIADEIDESEQERQDSLQFVRELFSELIETT